MKTVFFCLILIFCNFYSFARYDKVKDVVLIYKEAGLFSCFLDVLTLVHHYEKGKFNSIYVDFGRNGLYYDKAHGPNWWNYYFDPVDFGDRQVPLFKCARVMGTTATINTMLTERKMTRREAHTLINKYIKTKESLQQEVEEFEQANFTSFIIGVQYRGTDKRLEAPTVSYETVFLQIDKQIAELGATEYKIFVATDEQAFLEEMVALYGDKVCCLEGVYRSTSQVGSHYIGENRYENGKYAVMDCLLLSKTNILIRTSSNLSLVSTYYNPGIKVIELNKRKTYGCKERLRR